MSFEEIRIKGTYRTNEDNIIDDFLVPVLKQSIKYKRAAGFFSSTALIKLSYGISGLIKNHGQMQLVVSPKLSEEDIEAMKKGYENRQEIIEKALLNSIDLKEPMETNKDRLNLMIDLIEKGFLDIKIAFLNNDNNAGMYHEKIGVLEDLEGNRIAFTGSYNESLNSYVNNFESLDVYTSYSSEFNRVEEKESNFDKLWNNRTERLEVIEFPKVVKEQLIKRYYDKNNVKSEEEISKTEKAKKGNSLPNMPLETLREYQRQAIKEWKDNNYVGIFDMATGTGKTYTALGASTQLLKDMDEKLAIIIICPYTHLVEQWAEDLKDYGFNPIVGYGSLKDKRWKEIFPTKVLNYKLGLENYFCFITTNATYTTNFVQEQIKKIEKKNVLFIADEAHNLGASNLLSKLNSNIKYRIALSATFERYNDEIGTAKLSNYFNNKYVIHYSLKEAIDNDMLTEYKYYPILCTLNEDELEEYLYLTRKLKNCIKVSKTGERVLTELGKKILLERARLVAGSMDKMHKAIEIMKKQKEEEGEINNTLVYCGATTVNDTNAEVVDDDKEELKQVDYMRETMKKELNISVAKFTSNENQEERRLIKDQFKTKEINAIVAIKCLDEGVNIPAINTAYILASSTNPREYVQRRGRVLRKYPGKSYATIYDFITLPRKLENSIDLPQEMLNEDLGLVKRELIRLEDFSKDALNYSDSLKVIDQIKQVYGSLLNKMSKEDEIDG